MFIHEINMASSSLPAVQKPTDSPMVNPIVHLYQQYEAYLTHASADPLALTRKMMKKRPSLEDRIYALIAYEVLCNHKIQLDAEFLAKINRYIMGL